MLPKAHIVKSNRSGLAFPHLSRDPRPAGSQPPFGVEQHVHPYPIHYRLAFAYFGIPYPTVHRYTLAGNFPRSLWVRSGLPRFAQAPFTEGLGPAGNGGHRERGSSLTLHTRSAQGAGVTYRGRGSRGRGSGQGGQCVRARSQFPAGVNPAPARQASHRKENLGPAGVISKVKHRVIETAGRQRKLKWFQ